MVAKTQLYRDEYWRQFVSLLVLVKLAAMVRCMDGMSASDTVDLGLIPESGQAKDFRKLAFTASPLLKRDSVSPMNRQ